MKNANKQILIQAYQKELIKLENKLHYLEQKRVPITYARQFDEQRDNINEEIDKYTKAIKLIKKLSNDVSIYTDYINDVDLFLLENDNMVKVQETEFER